MSMQIRMIIRWLWLAVAMALFNAIPCFGLVPMVLPAVNHLPPKLIVPTVNPTNATGISVASR
jgi:hypothetical protein